VSGSSGLVEIESVSLGFGAFDFGALDFGGLNFGVLDSGVDFEVDLCFFVRFFRFFRFRPD